MTGTQPGPRQFESFALRLALPGSRDPLFLGEWQTRDETSNEAAHWQTEFPNARLVESGDA